MYLEQELMDLQTKMSFTATENPLSVWLYSLGGYSAKLAFWGTISNPLEKFSGFFSAIF